MQNIHTLKYLYSFLIFTALFLPSTAIAKAFDAKEFFLPNGMQVVLIENHRAPVVTHMVWYKVGAADEDIGHSGLAHFFEHLMFKGTESVPAGEFSKRVKRLGGNDNAFTSLDYTAYFQNVPVKHLGTVMQMEADRMRNLDVSDENIFTERDVIIEERKERVDNNPSGILREEINSALFANHPYRIPVIGWMSEIKSLTPDSVRAFYNKWYAPNNAILVVSGNITLEELKPLAEKYYGVIPPSPLPETTYPAPAPIKAEHRIKLKDPRVGSPTIQMTYRAPRGSEALQILADAFGGHSTTPFYKSLVIDQKLAVQAGVYYSAVAKDISTFTLYALPAPGVDLETLELSIKAEVDLLLENGLPNDAINQSKQRLIDAVNFERDSLTGPARIIGRALASGFALDDVENWPDDVKAVTKDNIYAARDTVFNGQDKPIIGYLVPETEIQ